MPEDAVSACQNPAVARCVQAYQLAYDRALGPRKDDISARTAGSGAFRRAMPPLVGAANIRDFIACVAYGMIANIFILDQGTKLLYAAQVAFSSSRKSRKSKKLSHK